MSSKKNEAEQMISMDLTTVCNLHCPECAGTFLRERGVLGIIHQPIELFEEIDTSFEKYSLVLSGNVGEPTLYPYMDQLLDILEHSTHIDKFRLFTNGVTHNPTWWENFSERVGRIPTEHKYIIASVDSLESSQYRKNANMKKGLENLRAMVNGNVKIIWQVVIFKYNEPEVEKIIHIARDYGVNTVKLKFSWNYPPGEEPQSYIHFRRMKDELKIGLPYAPCLFYNGNGAFMTPEGNIHPCCYFGVVEQAPKYVDVNDLLLPSFNVKRWGVKKAISMMKEWVWDMKDTPQFRRICDYFCRDNCKHLQRTWTEITPEEYHPPFVDYFILHALSWEYGESGRFQLDMDPRKGI